jgi:nicotinamide-nucleotide amidase
VAKVIIPNNLYQTNFLVNAHLLTIGDEILIGQIIDTNSAWMSRQLNLIGISVNGKSSVGDTRTDIIAGIEHALGLADIVLITGGLGPTKDDITKKTLADMFGSGMSFHQETFDRISAYFQKVGRPMPPSMRDQATLPDQALILINKVGTAAGMWFERDGKVLVSLPGVPFEMEYLMTNEVLPRLKNKFVARPIVHRTLLTAGEGESAIARRLEDFEETLPDYIKLAYLPALGQVRLRLTGVWPGEIMDDSEAVLTTEVEKYTAVLHNTIEDLIFGTETQTLQRVVGEKLRALKRTLATAESCTGGYISHLITSEAGASDFFVGSAITYSNDMKIQLLGVEPATIASFGAVSEETVREMAEGTVKKLGSDLAIAVSGIAGPDGGTAEKPVGTVWISVSNGNQTLASKFVFGRDRGKNIQMAGVYALNMLNKFIDQVVNPVAR